MVNLPPELLQIKNDQKIHKNEMIELIGREGSGAKRFALSFARPAKRVIWISKKWNIHSPLLWEIAQSFQMNLIGLECPERERWRFLFRELLEAEALDAWILDHLHLKEADGFFLDHLTRAHPIKIVVLENRPLSFCKKRIHIHRSGEGYRFITTKGGNPTPVYLNPSGTPVFSTTRGPHVCR